MSRVPLSELYISMDSPLARASTVTSNHIAMFDCIEYGMGFHRGYVDDFVNSEHNGNEMHARADVLEAFRDGEWSILPDKDHLRYILNLWERNLLAPSDERTQYDPPLGRKSESNPIQYPYDLFRANELQLYGPEGLTQSGVTQVWSTIPPYFIALLAIPFLDKHYPEIMDYLSQANSIIFLRRCRRSPIRKAFVTSSPLIAERPRPTFIEDLEEQARNQRLQAAKRLLARAQRDIDLHSAPGAGASSSVA